MYIYTYACVNSHIDRVREEVKGGENVHHRWF